jgi:chromosome segregation ATPase
LHIHRFTYATVEAGFLIEMDDDLTEAYQSMHDEADILFSQYKLDSGEASIDKYEHDKTEGRVDQIEEKLSAVDSCSVEAKMEALEKEVKAHRQELAAAKEEIESCKVANLELKQQVRDLTDTMTLKMKMESNQQERRSILGLDVGETEGEDDRRLLLQRQVTR